jgi:hypothetical protein
MTDQHVAEAEAAVEAERGARTCQTWAYEAKSLRALYAHSKAHRGETIDGGTGKDDAQVA